MICVLEVLRGPAKRSRYILRDKQHFEIGRSIGVDIYLPSDVHLSRRHVLIDGTGDHFSIRDLGSSNGTYLNDQRVMTAVLESGDILRVGETAFRVALLPDDVNPHAADGVSFSEGGLQGTHVDSVQPDHGADRFPTVRQSVSIDWSKVDREQIKGVDFLRSSHVVDAALSRMVNRYFTASKTAHLYELSHSIESPWGEYLGILLKLSQARAISVVFNVDRLGSVESEVLRRRQSQGDLSTITNGIVAGRIVLSDGNLRFLSGTLGRDAVVCIGSSEHLDLQELGQFAANLCSPSAFGAEIKKPTSELGLYLLKRHAWALFELSEQGPIDLFIDL